MYIMKKAALWMMVLGFVFWSISFLISINIKENQTLREIESFFGREVSLDQLSSMADLAGMFGVEMDFSTKVDIFLLKSAPVINTLGWIGLAGGAVLYLVDRFRIQDRYRDNSD